MVLGVWIVLLRWVIVHQITWTDLLNMSIAVQRCMNPSVHSLPVPVDSHFSIPEGFGIFRVGSVFDVSRAASSPKSVATDRRNIAVGVQFRQTDNALLHESFRCSRLKKRGKPRHP